MKRRTFRFYEEKYVKKAALVFVATNLLTLGACSSSSTSDCKDKNQDGSCKSTGGSSGTHYSSVNDSAAHGSSVSESAAHGSSGIGGAHGGGAAS